MDHIVLFVYILMVTTTGAGAAVGLTIYSGVFFLLRSVDRSHGVIHGVMTALALAAQLGRIVIFLNGSDRMVSTIRLPAIGLISIYLLYASIICWSARRRIDSATVSTLVGRLGMLLIVFGPLSATLSATLTIIPETFRPTVSLDFRFALGWSIVLVSGFVRYLTKPESPEGQKVSPGFPITARCYAPTPIPSAG